MPVPLFFLRLQPRIPSLARSFQTKRMVCTFSDAIGVPAWRFKRKKEVKRAPRYCAPFADDIQSSCPLLAQASLFDPLELTRGPKWPNRFQLAPLTNSQSEVDGTLSNEEYNWLTLRAKGGFGCTMTCASHVQRIGQGFPGQLGSWDDKHLAGLKRISDKIREYGSVSSVQLHHAGFRSPADIIGELPVSPSGSEDPKARALTLEEVHQLRDDFIEGAIRAEKAGFDGVELHGAHGENKTFSCRVLDEVGS